MTIVRGRLRMVASSLQAAIRLRRFSFKQNRSPDWFVDKTNQEEIEKTEKVEAIQTSCFGYKIGIDPSHPLYYKVRDIHRNQIF